MSRDPAPAPPGAVAAAPPAPLRVSQVIGATLRRRRRPLLRLALWSGAEALPALLTGALTARAVDDGFLAGRPGVGLAWLGLVAVATLVGAVGTRQAYGGLADIVEPFRDELAHRVVSGALHRSTLPDARPETAAVARLTHQVELVRDTLAGLVMVVRAFLFTATAALIGLVALDAVVAGLVAVPLLVSLALFAAALPAMINRQRDYVRADDRLGEMAGTVLAGHRDVAACGAADRAVAMVREPVRAQAAAERALARMAALRSLILAVGGWLPLGVLLAVAPWLVRRGLTAGAVLGALVYVCAALQPALRALVLGVAGGGLRFAVTLDRILSNTTATPPGSVAGTAEASPGTPSGAVPVARSDRDSGVDRRAGTDDGTGGRPASRRLDGGPRHARRRCPEPGGDGDVVHLHRVDFRYGRDARPVLSGLDLTIGEGEHLAVVGPSGTGKSTLVALIAGMLTPQAGSVCLAGRPVTGRPATELANARVVIPQQAYVFGGSLAENLRYLAPAVPANQVERVVDLLGLRPVADRLGGLDATVRPDTLSAGERQLIAAVRAYLCTAPVAILDEATCHLDPAAEAVVEQAFANRPGTLIVVAHRISSARRAGRVLVLDGDRTMVGRHDTLLASSAAYRDLVGVDQPS